MVSWANLQWFFAIQGLSAVAGAGPFPAQLSGERDDGRLAATGAALDPLVEPAAQWRVWLMPQPQPGQLDHCRPEPRITGL